MCLPDFHNLHDIVNVGWKRKCIDMQTNPFNACMKPTYLIFCTDEWVARHESLN